MNDDQDLVRPKYDTFEAIYTSGLLVDSSLLTALCLIFDKIHILNNIEFPIEFSKVYRFTTYDSKLFDMANNVEIVRVGDELDEDDPISSLNDEQLFTVKYYLANVFNFGIYYHDLFQSKVINCSIFEDNKPLKVELVKKGKPGELNTYRVLLGKQLLSTGGIEELNNMVDSGKIPIIGNPHVSLENAETDSVRFTASQLASILALKSLNLVLPQTKSVDADTILEARERLKDYLLPFWSSMLHLTGYYRSLLYQNTSPDEIEKECEFIDTHIRPRLIDLTQKITKERKGWFGRIVTPVINGVKIFAVKPPLTTTDLLTTGVAAGANITLDLIRESMKISSSTKQSGLTLLIELEKYLRNK